MTRGVGGVVRQHAAGPSGLFSDCRTYLWVRFEHITSGEAVMRRGSGWGDLGLCITWVKQRGWVGTGPRSRTHDLGH